MVPLNDLQTALNNRVAGLGQTGAMQSTQPQFGLTQQGGVGITQIPQQQFGMGQIGQMGINQIPQQQVRAQRNDRDRKQRSKRGVEDTEKGGAGWGRDLI